jgi:hypothetical protein
MDHFFCFTCDEYVWDCDHLIDELLSASRVPALKPSQLQSFAYDGKSRTLEIEFGVLAPAAYNEMPLPPPPHVIQYFNVPRYVFAKLLQYKIGQKQERYWADNIRTRLSCQTVRTVCRLPRIWKFSESRNIRRYDHDEYVCTLSGEDQQTFLITVMAMRILLLRTLAPKRVAGLGGLLGSFSATIKNTMSGFCRRPTMAGSCSQGPAST